MDFLFGADMPLAVRFFFAFVIVLALIGGTAFLVRRFGGERLGTSSSRGRQPRLAVIDAAAVDGRRRLILIRRDNVEHLLMIGGPSDVVVEANIVRAAAPARDAGAQRQPADALPRPIPMGEGNMWPLQPEPAPAQRPPRQPAAEEPMPWHNEPEAPPMPPPPPRRPEARTEPRVEMRPEPRVEPIRPEPRVEPIRPEPRGEPVRPELRVEPIRPEPRPDAARAEPRPDGRPEPRVADPLAGLAAELARVQSEAKPRPQRERSDGVRAVRVSQPERGRPPTPQPAADEPAAPTADQNLAEMAQRLEAALRRPRPADARGPDTAPKPAAEPLPDAPPHAAAADAAPREDTPPGQPQQPAPPRGSAPKPQKSVYDSLEQEMASLLGRPNSKT